jgi:hypothetical protein
LHDLTDADIVAGVRNTGVDLSNQVDLLANSGDNAQVIQILGAEGLVHVLVPHFVASK